jgi:RNA polymerase sigma-70 factor (ECF subfamily)
MHRTEKPVDPDAGTDDDRVARFKVFYQAHYLAISGYVRRRVPEHESADIMAQVFTVAWRRFEVVPCPPSDRPWLYGVARKSVADYRRSLRRRLRLLARLSQEATRAPSTPDELGPARARVEAAIRRLRPRDREVLTLVIWDDLSHAEVAAVLGCSVNAVELRLRRARSRVREALLATDASIDTSVAPPATAAPN